MCDRTIHGEDTAEEVSYVDELPVSHARRPDVQPLQKRKRRGRGAYRARGRIDVELEVG